MVAISQRRIFPEDVAFGEATEKLYGAGESVRNKPLDFGRRGGESLRQAGDLYSTFLGAVGKAVGDRDLRRGSRELDWARARRMKAAATDAAKAGAVRDLTSGIYGGLMDFVAKKRLEDKEAEPAETVASPGSSVSPSVGGEIGAKIGGENESLVAVPTPQAVPVAVESPVIRFPGDDRWEFQKVNGVWKTRAQGSGTWRDFAFPQWQTDKLEAMLLGVRR